MHKFFFAIAFVTLSIFCSSCKKDKVDPCIEKFAGTWHFTGNSTHQFGSCNLYQDIHINPGPDGGCQVMFPNLPDGCNESSNQVIGFVSGDSIFVVNEPFGLNTISASGRVYLNQFTFHITISDGHNTTLSGNR